MQAVSVREIDGGEALYAWSGRKEITVIEGKTTASTVTKRADGCRIETTLQGVTSGTLVVAGYENGRLVDLKMLECSGQTPETELVGDMDEIRVFVLQNIETLLPVCAAEVIPDSEWLSE